MKISENFVERVYECYEHIHPFLIHTPMIQHNHGDKTCFIKCENLQHTNSFKYRGAFAAIYLYQRLQPSIWDVIVKNGIVTCSTGNFAKALAYLTALQNINLSVIVHEYVDNQKIRSILEYNSKTEIIKVSYNEWKNIILDNRYDKSNRFFISTSINDHVTLGNATLGIEILKQLPDIASIIIPYGGGNLSYSLALFLKHTKPTINIHTVEVSTGSPFHASFQLKKPTFVPYKKSFVDGIGSDFVIPQQFERVLPLVKNALVVSPYQIRKTMVQLMKENIKVEGAGAASIAAGIKYSIEEPMCCILSGGNLSEKLSLSIAKSLKKGAKNEQTIT